ncbi:hsp12 variant C [Helicobacter pylori CPY6271]|nr:hsp12 variant C [Helicobacter pylori CPY6271]
MFSGGLMAEQDSKELILSGITIYTDKNSTRAKKYLKKLAD